MKTILHTGLGEELGFLEERYGELFSFQPFTSDDQLTDAEVFLIGPHEPGPVRLVQKIYAADKLISIIVLAFAGEFARTKQSLQFAPFVGKNSSCISYSRQFDLLQAVETAAQRTMQRRSFSRINKTAAAVTSLASIPVKIQNLGVFLDNAPIGTIIIDQKENILALNQKAKKIFEVPGEQNLVLKDLFRGMSLQQLSWKTAVENSWVIRLQDRFLELNLSKIENEEDDTLFILLINDITVQKIKEAELQQSEALFRLMAESLPQLVWTADENGYRNYFNQNWLHYTGRSNAELEGWQWTDLIHPEDQKMVIPRYREAIHSVKAFQYELRLLRHDGIYRWHLVRGVPHKDVNGKVILWIGTNTDIHEHKAFAEELEKRVKERTYELEASNSELEQFVYVTSHDLQEPLRKIRMFSDLLSGSAETMDARSCNYLEKINATAYRMSTLLKELLNFTQMSKEEQFEPTDLNQIIDHVLEDLELIIQQKSATIKVEPLPVIRAVPVQIQQLFYNLINNALKFTKAGEPPLIEIRSVPANLKAANQKHLHRDKKYVELVISDNGIGFDQNHAAQIFNIFQRLHNRSSYSGTGIGLALCKKVVAHHYGEIYAVSETGKGAAFHVLLPE